MEVSGEHQAPAASPPRRESLGPFVLGPGGDRSS
jgi:hypothetical protein